MQLFYQMSLAERRQSIGFDWHPWCLKCEECGKRLNPGQHAEVGSCLKRVFYLKNRSECHRFLPSLMAQAICDQQNCHLVIKDMIKLKSHFYLLCYNSYEVMKH
jgi:hypothetical protein